MRAEGTEGAEEEVRPSGSERLPGHGGNGLIYAQSPDTNWWRGRLPKNSAWSTANSWRTLKATANACGGKESANERWARLCAHHLLCTLPIVLRLWANHPSPIRRLLCASYSALLSPYWFAGLPWTPHLMRTHLLPASPTIVSASRSGCSPGPPDSTVSCPLSRYP